MLGRRLQVTWDLQMSCMQYRHLGLIRRVAAPNLPIERSRNQVRTYCGYQRSRQRMVLDFYYGEMLQL